MAIIALGSLFLIGIAAGLYVLRNPETTVLDEGVRQQLGGTYLQLSDGVTRYALEGDPDGPKIVLVHGGTVPLWTWDDLAADLIDTGWCVLRYDAYGRGYSDRPRLAYDRACYLRQLLDLVDTLGWTAPFDLVGYSLGGATATNFTARHPERVRRLLLISPVMKDYPIPKPFLTPLVGDWLARMAGMRTMVSRIQHWWTDGPDRDRKVAMFVQQATYVGFQRSLLSMLRNDALTDYSAAYHTVGAQDRAVLLLWGTEDREISSSMIEAVRAEIPHARYIPVTNADHGVVFQDPKAITSAILEFLQND